MKGIFITMEGPDGSGKTTQIELLKGYLEKKGYDIVITRDILLAERLLAKEITTINDRGLCFTKENIKEKLSMRNFNLELFECGLIGDKTSTFGKKELNDFANCFDREIQKKLKK